MTRLETPVWIPQAVWLAGLALFLLVGLLMLVRGILALARGDLATISRMIGSRSAQEEMEEELAEATRAAEDVRRQP